MEPWQSDATEPTATAARDGPLLAAAAWSLGSALLSRELGLPGAAVAWIVATLWVVHRQAWSPAVLALPAALAALPSGYHEFEKLPAGPVALSGHVTRVFRSDPIQRQRAIAITHSGRTVGCLIDGGDQDLFVGDAVDGVGRSRGDGWVACSADQLTIRTGIETPARLCARLRSAGRKAIVERVPGESGRLVAGLVLGRGPRLPDELVTAHRATGLTHLLAVSGAHISMLAFLLGLMWGRRFPLDRATYRLGCAVILVVYGGVTGFDPPVFRAVAAFLLAVWGGSHYRPVRVAQVLAAPAILSALLAPEGLLGVSFSLSYAAVFGLSLAGRWPASGPWAQLLASLRASFWAMVVTAPLTLLWFGQFAPWTLLGTPLLAPLVGALLAAGLLVACCACWAPALADGIALFAGALADIYCEGVRSLALLPWTPVLARAAPEPSVLAAALCIAAAGRAFRNRRRHALFASICLSVPFFIDPGHSPGLALVDVGHGQSCLVRTGQHTILIDCGTLGSGPAALRAVHRALGPSRTIDLLVITHGDRDHTSLVPDVVSSMPVGAVCAPAELRRHPDLQRAQDLGIPIRWLNPRERYAPIEGIEVWAPDPARRRNDRSLWVRAEFAGSSALLPGDAEEDGIRSAVAHGFVRPTDVLVLPHHGRSNERFEALIQRAAPQIALVSATAADGGTILGETLRRRGVPVHSTGESGSLHVGPQLDVDARSDEDQR